MKTVTKLVMLISFATFMFAGVSFSVSNHYTDAVDGDYMAARTFGIAFDVNDKKVGSDLSDAIFAHPNNTAKIIDVPSHSRCHPCY